MEDRGDLDSFSAKLDFAMANVTRVQEIIGVQRTLNGSQPNKWDATVAAWLHDFEHASRWARTRGGKVPGHACRAVQNPDQGLT
jgi:hypothetical protein